MLLQNPNLKVRLYPHQVFQATLCATAIILNKLFLHKWKKFMANFIFI